MRRLVSDPQEYIRLASQHVPHREDVGVLDHMLSHYTCGHVPHSEDVGVLDHMLSHYTSEHVPHSEDVGVLDHMLSHYTSEHVPHSEDVGIVPSKFEKLLHVNLKLSLQEILPCC